MENNKLGPSKDNPPKLNIFEHNKYVGDGIDTIKVQVPSLPSNSNINQVVSVKFTDDMIPLTATVVGVNFYKYKVKYDLSIWIDDNQSTIIKDVDSLFITNL